MLVKEFIRKLSNTPNDISFNDTMTIIDLHFNYTPSRFTNGRGDAQVINEAGSNEGSCKIFSLAKLLALEESQTLHCFGDYYRLDVMQHPDGNDHANIRNFITHGWDGIAFDNTALKEKVQ